MDGDPPAGAPPPHPGHHRAEDFEATYASGDIPPWDIGRPQPAFERLARSGGLVGTVLDVGCGTGEHALLAAALGHDAVGVDLAPTAVARAAEKAATRALAARFVVWDALRLPELGERFDTVLDCGLFHGFGDDDRARFVDSLAGVVPPGGRYHMLCFSDRQPGDWGPRRVTRAEILAAFWSGWRVDAVEPATLELRWDPARVEAWQVAATRTATG